MADWCRDCQYRWRKRNFATGQCGWTALYYTLGPAKVQWRNVAQNGSDSQVWSWPWRGFCFKNVLYECQGAESRQRLWSSSQNPSWNRHFDWISRWTLHFHGCFSFAIVLGEINASVVVPTTLTHQSVASLGPRLLDRSQCGQDLLSHTFVLDMGCSWTVGLWVGRQHRNHVQLGHVSHWNHETAYFLQSCHFLLLFDFCTLLVDLDGWYRVDGDLKVPRLDGEKPALQ